MPPCAWLGPFKIPPLANFCAFIAAICTAPCAAIVAAIIGANKEGTVANVLVIPCATFIIAWMILTFCWSRAAFFLILSFFASACSSVITPRSTCSSTCFSRAVSAAPIACCAIAKDSCKVSKANIALSICSGSMPSLSASVLSSPSSSFPALAISRFTFASALRNSASALVDSSSMPVSSISNKSPSASVFSITAIWSCNACFCNSRFSK